MMSLTIGEAIQNYKRLKILRFDDILCNVLYDGTYAVTKKYTRMTEEYREFYNRNAAKETLGHESQTDNDKLTVQ